MDTILVIDIGQTRCRVSIVDREGGVIAGATRDYLTGKLADWLEQEPRDWWLAMTRAVEELKEKGTLLTPSAIALTGQTRIVLLAGDEDRLDAAILMADRRASLEWKEMVDRIGLETLLRTANIIHEETSQVAKLMWLKKHQPTNYQQARTLFLGAHDYMTWRLCGARVTDYTTASYTDLFALQEDAWATELLQSLDLRTDWLPDLVHPGARVGELSADVATTLGLPAGIPIFHGAADTAALVIGAGVSRPGEYACFLGESGWLATPSLNELGNPITGLLNVRDPEQAQLLVVGPMITAAGNFEWLKDRFGPAEEKTFPDANMSLTDLLMTLAAEAVPGSGGVIYLPYLAGEQSPYRDPNARAGWFYVSRRTWRSDLYRAVLEGVAYSMRAIQLLMPEPPEGSSMSLRLVGDESCSPLWAQIFADVFSCNVDILSPSDDVTARGAAYYAGRTLGWYEAPVPPYEFIRSQGTFVPFPDNAEIYDRRFEAFWKLYPSLRGLYQEITPESIKENPQAGA